MDYLQAAILGTLQGAAEFLPISSSGHLEAAKQLFGMKEMPLLFSTMLHLGTLLAIVIFYRARIFSLCRSLGRFIFRCAGNKEMMDIHYILHLLYATFVTALIGIPLYKYVIADLVRAYPASVSVAFLLTALVLMLNHPQVAKIRIRGFVPSKFPIFLQLTFIGLFQALAIMPGISRSGMTLTASMRCGWARRKAGEFSFLLSIPAILGGVVLDLKDLRGMLDTVPPSVLITGIAVSFAVGLASLALLIRVLRGSRFWLFSIYLTVIGAVILLFPLLSR